LGGIREKAGDRKGAAQLYRQALAKEETASGTRSTRVAVRLNTLSRVVDPAEGIALLERALTINLERVGSTHLETATIQANLADLLLVGRPQDALKLARHALSGFEMSLRADHPRTMVVAAIVADCQRAAQTPRRPASK
jgi:hypothetical protein